MTELLVKPYRESNQKEISATYGWYSTYPQLRWIAPELPIASIAAKLRAEHRLKTPDAMQAATAIHAGATGLIANDPVFSRVKEFEALLLDDIL